MCAAADKVCEEHKQNMNEHNIHIPIATIR